jgi:hypothetical protein
MASQVVRGIITSLHGFDEPEDFGGAGLTSMT